MKEIKMGWYLSSAIPSLVPSYLLANDELYLKIHTYPEKVRVIVEQNWHINIKIVMKISQKYEGNKK